MRARLAAALPFAVPFLLPFVLAAGYTPQPEAAGRWHDWAPGSPTAAKIKNAPETGAAMATLEEIQKIFAKTPTLASPHGVNIVRTRSVTASTVKVPFHSNLLLILLDLTKKNDCATCAIEEEEEGPSFAAHVNTFFHLVPQVSWQSENLPDQPKIFFEPRLAPEKEVGGFPLYQGYFGTKWVVVTRKGRPPIFRPVSNETAIDRLVRTYETKIAKYAASGKKLPGEELMVQTLKAELASLSPEERAQQGWSGCKGKNAFLGAARLCRGAPGPNDKDVFLHVELNPDFWDTSLPPQQPQAILLDVMMTNDPKKPYRHRLASKVISELDWKALGALVEQGSRYSP